MSFAAPDYTRRVCVVIHTQGVSEDDLRLHLGSALPLKFTSWEDHTYLAAIRHLKPRVIVVAASDERASDLAALLGALLNSDSLTIATFVLALERLSVQQLGAGTQAHVRSLDDLLIQ